MPWGRLIVALLVTGLAVSGIGFAGAQLTGLYRMELPSAPGLNQADAAALAQPFADLAGGADAQLIARLAGNADPAQAARQIDQMQALLPAAAPTSSRLVVWSVTHDARGQALRGVHEYGFADHVARVETVLTRARDAEPWRVDGFHINVASRAELAQNQFTLAGKPPHFLAVVAGLAINPLFILITFWTALFQQGLKPRWLWLIAILIGVGTFTMDAASGAWTFNPISFQLFGASAMWSGSAFDHWVIGVSFPAGALAFWLTRPFARRSAAPAAA